jgi:Protein of unknown function (DUF2568)
MLVIAYPADMSSAAPGPQPPRLFAPNEVLAFLLEIIALLILADWGWHRGEASGTRLLQAIGAPLLAAVVWGLFAAPRAKFTIPLAGQLAVKVLVFGWATWALFDLKLPALGVVFALVVIVNTTAATVWRRRGFTIQPPQR